VALYAVVVLFVARTAQARPKTDIVTMTNGDRYTCEIVSLAQGQLKIKTANTTGTVVVDWAKVDRIETTQYFAVELSDGRTLAGVISKAPAKDGVPHDFRVEGPDAALEAAATEVVTIKRSGMKLKGRLSGGISAGFSYAKGNNQTTYNLNGDVSARGRSNEFHMAYSSNYSGQPGDEGTSRYDLVLQYWKNLSRNWMVGSYTDFLRSEEQQLDLRATLGAIVGRRLVRTNRTLLTVVSGIVFTTERYSPDSGLPARHNNVEGLGGVSFSIFRFDSTNVTADSKLFPSITDPGRFRIDTSINGKIDLTHSIYWNVSLYSNYDSRPPIPDVPKSDFGVSFGLGWTF
jgi:hypothetical protein